MQRWDDRRHGRPRPGLARRCRRRGRHARDGHALVRALSGRRRRQPVRDWEFTSELQRWDDAPAPGKMGRKIIEAVTGRDVPVVARRQRGDPPEDQVQRDDSTVRQRRRRATASPLLGSSRTAPANVLTWRSARRANHTGLIPRIDRAIVVRCCNTPELRFTLVNRANQLRALARGLAAARSGSTRLRARCLSAVPGEVRRCGVGAARGSGRQAPAPAVGEHRNEEPRLLRRALRLGADRPGCREHDARADPSRIRRPRRGQAHAGSGLGRRLNARWRTLVPPESISAASRRSSSAKASNRSATPTTSCSTALRASSAVLATS